MTNLLYYPKTQTDSNLMYFPPQSDRFGKVRLVWLRPRVQQVWSHIQVKCFSKRVHNFRSTTA